jgi:hypothetical protein
MEGGMGIHEGGALSDAGGAAFGRAINVGAEPERAVSNMPMSSAPQPRVSQPGLSVAPNAGLFPGYPQDMFMVMDDMVAKPETYGLRPGWSGGTMGMMTIVRVLRPELFDKIQELKAEAAKKAATR